jgi:hypothetical protein
MLQEFLPKGGDMHRLEVKLRQFLTSIWMVSSFGIYLSLFEPVELRAQSGLNDL